ncbi:Phosphoinositide-3-kinase-interacting protein [Dirofilaria immitis]
MENRFLFKTQKNMKEQSKRKASPKEMKHVSGPMKS